jgi:hypothetical protein
VAVAAIAMESYGGYMRAIVLAGADELTRSGATGLLATKSAGVSALFSFITPTAAMIAGAMSFDGLLVPLRHHGMRIFRIIPLWLLRGAYYLLFGPFLREPYLHDPEIEVPAEPELPEDIALPEEVAQPQPIIQSCIMEADTLSRAMVDEAVEFKTEAHALALAMAGLLGSMAIFIATKVKQSPKHIIDVNPANIVAEFIQRSLRRAANRCFKTVRPWRGTPPYRATPPASMPTIPAKCCWKKSKRSTASGRVYNCWFSRPRRARCNWPLSSLTASGRRIPSSGARIPTPEWNRKVSKHWRTH